MIPSAALKVRQQRGTSKNTIYTKKKSVSLLPPNGQMNFFTGVGMHAATYRDTAVGMLFDLKLLHTKGERYIWTKDAYSSDSPWKGLLAYFGDLDAVNNRFKKILYTYRTNDDVRTRFLASNIINLSRKLNRNISSSNLQKYDFSEYTIRLCSLRDCQLHNTNFKHTHFIDSFFLDDCSYELIKNFKIPPPYEGMNITGVRGLEPAQIERLKDLGAVEDKLD